MDIKAATKIAKNANTTAEQLTELIGFDKKIDRLVVKHPNATVRMLENFAKSTDKPTQKSVALNQAISTLLSISGAASQLASHFGMEQPATLPEVNIICRSAQRAIEAPHLKGISSSTVRMPRSSHRTICGSGCGRRSSGWGKGIRRKHRLIW